MSTMSDAQYASILKNLHTANDAPYAHIPPANPATAEEVARLLKRNALLESTIALGRTNNDQLRHLITQLQEQLEVLRRAHEIRKHEHV
jgi:hypothetical protein